MAVGTIEQFKGPLFKGPFNAGSTISLSGPCKIGVSINEDDYFLYGPTSSFKFYINGKQIWMGRTYMYETGEQVNNPVIIFPDETPASVTVNIMYCQVYKNQYTIDSEGKIIKKEN